MAPISLQGPQAAEIALWQRLENIVAVVNVTNHRHPSGSRSTPFGLWCLLLFLSLFFAAIAVSNSHNSVRLSEAYLRKLESQYGYEAAVRLRRWQKLIKDIRNDSEAQKLKKVNDFFNTVRYVNDIDHWKKEDYWATPVEFLITNAGDCEDYSIAKYYTLRELGIPDSKMSIAYVKALEYNQAHMVLTYYQRPKAMPVVLDNLIPEIKPANKRRDLVHVYSFNGENLWLTRRGKRAKIIGTSDRLEHWVKVKSRIATQKVNSNP